MPYDLALYDLISPYVLRGDTFGQWHAALSVIYVAEHTVTMDDGGIVIRGVGRFSGDVSPYVDPSKMTFGVNAQNTEGHPANDPGRRDPWIDVHDAHIDFELSAPRKVSQKVANAVVAIGGAAGFANAAAVRFHSTALAGAVGHERAARYRQHGGPRWIRRIDIHRSSGQPDRGSRKLKIRQEEIATKRHKRHKKLNSSLCFLCLFVAISLWLFPFG